MNNPNRIKNRRTDRDDRRMDGTRTNARKVLRQTRKVLRAIKSER